MIAKSIRLVEKFSGSLLGGVAVSAQLGNVLVCVLILIAGPAFVLGLLPR
jgi:hypothetical protein